MAVLDRESLEQSPLADLHAIASELSIDGYRRLRKPELIDMILERQSGVAGKREAGAEDNDEEEQPTARRRRGRRGGRGRGAGRPDADAREDEAEPADEREAAEDKVSSEREVEREDEPEAAADEIVEGVVELLPNGSGFARLNPPEPSDDDVYVSAAQVKRCELVSGDRITGPRRAPRRSERFASLVRVDTINGRPAGELADSARFDDLPAAFPSRRLRLDSEHPAIRAIDAMTPIGRGSRVVIAGGPQAGKTTVLRELAAALSRDEELQLWLVLAGVRPEEITEWRTGLMPPAAAVGLAGSADVQGQAVEGVVEQARRMASRGSHTVVLVDTLDGILPHVARRVLAAARSIADGGSLTVIATASDPLGGETTVIALDALRSRAERSPALDPIRSWTTRPAELVGGAGAEAVAAAQAEAIASLRAQRS